MVDPIEVLQADRDAAADMWIACNMGSKEAADEMHAGRADRSLPVQILARHRTEGLRKSCAPWESYHGDLPDYDCPLRPVYESGIQYTVELLAKDLGVEDWTPCDGTEEFDGDLGGTLMNIVLEAMPKDEHGDPIYPRDLPAAIAAMPPPASSLWLPIETAPKETMVLIFEPYTDRRRFSLNSRAQSMVARNCYGEWRSAPGEYRFYPTHWQPLPAPPSPKDTPDEHR